MLYEQSIFSKIPLNPLTLLAFRQISQLFKNQTICLRAISHGNTMKLYVAYTQSYAQNLLVINKDTALTVFFGSLCIKSDDFYRSIMA